MVSLLARLAYLAVAACYLVNGTRAAPADGSSLVARKSSATQAAPRFVIYDDKYVSGAAPPPSLIQVISQSSILLVQPHLI